MYQHGSGSRCPSGQIGTGGVTRNGIRDNYYFVGQRIYTRERGRAVCQRSSTTASLRQFRFSRTGPKGQALDEALASAMTPAGAAQPTSANPPVPAGFTYLGQFIDHDRTFDRTSVALGGNVLVDELLQGRSPALDLDSLYGRGPNHSEDQRFYSDGICLRIPPDDECRDDRLVASPGRCRQNK